MLHQEDQEALAHFLRGPGLTLGYDRRFRGACLFHDCECDSAVYCSAVTGSWFCFCTHHEGRNYGTVGDLENVGFPLQHARGSAGRAWEEVQHDDQGGNGSVEECPE
jgi:hypothetical protein